MHGGDETPLSTGLNMFRSVIVSDKAGLTGFCKRSRFVFCLTKGYELPRGASPGAP